MRNFSPLVVACFGASLLIFPFSPRALCQYQESVGYNRLVQELNQRGIAIPNGAGLRVGLVEARVGGFYFPNSVLPEFSGKTFINLGPDASPSSSGHANGVGSLFFGNTGSMAAGVTQIDVYEADRFVLTQQGLNPNLQPQATNVAVMNHSYIGNLSPSSEGVEANARMDYTVTRDGFTNVVALNNGVGTPPQIYAQSYNSIVVGRSDGQHSYGFTNIGVTGRTKPDIVAPQGTTSSSTPVVSSAATMLHSAANSLNMTNARAPEVMKAILMAGADKTPFNSWSNTSTRPLDPIFGAGEVDVYNSYKILEGGEFNGSDVFSSVDSGLHGWDLGSIEAGDSQFWTFEISPGNSISEASALLTWNARYEDAQGNFDLSQFTVANMSMRLYEANGASLGSMVALSDSPVDNVEHLYLRNLSSGRYALEISSDIATRFGLAWQITAVPEPNTMLLLSVALVTGGVWRRISRSRS
ncbi:PEP-CTERM sorting domain-containing protein [Pirellulaceae bacterium SH501]